MAKTPERPKKEEENANSTCERWLVLLSQHLKEIETELKCSICLGVFTEPHSLPCNHMFCRDCIMECITVAKQSCCPLCVLPVHRRQVVVNRSLGNIVAAYHGLVEVKEELKKTKLLDIDNIKTKETVFSPAALALKRALQQNNPANSSSGNNISKNLGSFRQKSKQTEGNGEKRARTEESSKGIAEKQKTPQNIAEKVCKAEENSESREDSNDEDGSSVNENSVCGFDFIENASKEKHSPNKRRKVERKEPKGFALLGTGLLNDTKVAMQNAVKQLGGKIATGFSSNVTHLVVQSRDGMAPRTLKYLKCVLGGRFIVLSSWIVDSLKSGYWLNEEEYEITGDTSFEGGPRRARLSISNKEPPLFYRTQIYFHGPFGLFGPTKSQSRSLASQGGATTISKLPTNKTPKPSGKNKIVVIVSEEDGQSEDLELDERSDIAGVVSIKWLLDSISAYEKQPLKNYAVA